MTIANYHMQMPDNDISISLSPFSCSVKPNNRDNLIWKLKAIKFRDKSRNWFVSHEAEFLQTHSNHISIKLTTDQSDLSIVLEIKIIKNNLSLKLTTNDADSIEWLGLDFEANKNEHFIGLGERFDSVDQTGKRIDLLVVNGSTGGRTYKPVPFFMSDSGYGVHIDTGSRTIIDLSTEENPNDVRIHVSDSTVALNFSFFPTFKLNLAHYSELAGRPELPPAWVFGPWKSRDWMQENQRTALEDIEMTRHYNLAGTVKVIDAAWESQLNDFLFDPINFPEAQEYIDRVHSLGFKLIVWIAPWMVHNDPPSSIYKYCADRGYLIRNSDGEIYIHNLGNSPIFMGSCFDFSNPEAVHWWQTQIKRLVKMGIDGFKTDFGEQVPLDAVFSDGLTGEEYHNIFPVIYNKTTFDAMNSVKAGVIFARSAWHGSQPFGTIWAGDQTSDFSPANGLPSVIIAGQSAGISGFPFWTCDIGGYFGSPIEKAFIRWIQFGAFSPIMQVHGLGNREPWNYSENVLRIYKRYAQIHLDLFPYIYTFAKLACESGLPIMRALALDYQDDPDIWGYQAQHQYMFGDSLLVAPIYSGDDSFSYIYLPKGDWYDFWNGKLYEGEKQIRFASDLETIPVFAKSGAIIPLLADSPNTLVETSNPEIKTANNDLVLRLFPGEDGHLKMYDGTVFSWSQNKKILQIFDSPFDRQISIEFPGENFTIKEISDRNNNQINFDRHDVEEGSSAKFTLNGTNQPLSIKINFQSDLNTR